MAKEDVQDQDQGEETLAKAVAVLIVQLGLDPTTAMVALFPMTAHAALSAGISKQGFLETAAITFDYVADNQVEKAFSKR